MGFFNKKSSSVANTTNNSLTENINAPTTQTGDNPISLFNSKAQLGGSGNVNGALTLAAGATLNTLDGGAIKQAFEFGTSAIASSLEAVKIAKQSASEAQNAAYGFASGVNSTASPDAQNNKTIMILGVVVLAYIISKGYLK